MIPPFPLPRLPLLFILILLCRSPAHLILQPPHEDRAENLKFGQSTCITRDGRRFVIGANGFEKYKGAIYVYDLSSGSGTRLEHWRRTRLSANGSQPAEEKKPRELRAVPRGSGFGFSCAITANGDYLVVGAPGHDMQKGVVFLFGFDEQGRRWKEVGGIQAEGGRSGDLFGWAVGVDDECENVVVSAKGRRANNGEVYGFRCARGCQGCELSKTIGPPDFTDSNGPRGIRIRNNFGVSLAVAGGVLAVGCTGFEEEKGAVYVYGKGEKGEEEWTLLQRLQSPKGQKFGFFGFKVAMDEKGGKIVVGADGEDEYRGAVYVFKRKVGKGGKIEYKYAQELVSDERMAEDNFGGSVALSGDGRALIVGAPGANRHDGKDHGVMYVYEEIWGRREVKWELAESVWLPVHHSSNGNFFAWTVAVSGNGGRYVATSPDFAKGMGVVAVGEFEVKGKRALDHKSLADDDVVGTEEKEDL